MMFVLGGYWAWDPAREVFRLQDQILVKSCKYDVKSPHFVGVKHEVCI